MNQYAQNSRLNSLPSAGDAGEFPDSESARVAPNPPFQEAVRIYEQGYLSRTSQLAKPTREKEMFYLETYIVPRWGSVAMAEMHPQAIEEWLHGTFRAWWTMHGVRAILRRIFHYAEEYGLWRSRTGNPALRAKLGRKRFQHERRILSLEETARVLACLEEPNLLVIETCIATGARISEILGLRWKCVDLCAGAIRIDQRLWRGDLDRTKTEGSRRVLGIGMLAPRYHAKAAAEMAAADAFVFQQKRQPGKPLWDSGIRDALHLAAREAGCDFPGLGPHSFRRANITWRQQVGGSAIEASKIAGHSALKMTGEYTFVDPARQNELTRRIQKRIAEAAGFPDQETQGAGQARELREPAPICEPASPDASIQDPPRPTPEPGIPFRRSRKKAKVREGSKAAAILALLETAEGVTMSELMRFTGWQAHSVRGFISAVVMKRLERRVESSAGEGGDRVYRIRG